MHLLYPFYVPGAGETSTNKISLSSRTSKLGADMAEGFHGCIYSSWFQELPVALFWEELWLSRTEYWDQLVMSGKDTVNGSEDSRIKCWQHWPRGRERQVSKDVQSNTKMEMFSKSCGGTIKGRCIRHGFNGEITISLSLDDFGLKEDAVSPQLWTECLCEPKILILKPQAPVWWY